ncbi:MAG: lipopolysaccharide biosynthesis protein [Bacteroidota bacterium]
MSSLREKTGKALFWDLIGNYGGQISGFIISIFLARLLEPKEFGLVGMSLVFINIMKVLMDMGLASALVQNKNNTSRTYSSVFYVNITFAILLTVIIYSSAPWIGIFYNSDTVTQLVRFLSISFFISSFNIVQSTILTINLDFKNLTYRDLFSKIVAGFVAVIFAYKGYGVYALVIQLILSEIVKSILLWKVTEWYPKFEFSLNEVKKLTGFSIYVLAAQSANKVISELDTLVVGKLFSSSLLGFYSRANSLNQLIIRNSSTSLKKVFFPVLSKVQDDEERFTKIFLQVIDIVSGLAVMLTGIFFLGGEELIIGLFGEKWEPSVLIFQILILRGFTYPISAIIVNAFLAKGKSKENFHYGNIRKALQLLPLLIAYLYGFYPFIYSLVGISTLGWLLNNFFATYSLGIPFADQIKAVGLYLLMGSTIVALITLLFPEGRNYLMAITKAVTFILLYLGIANSINSVLTEEGKFYLKRAWQKSRNL